MQDIQRKKNKVIDLRKKKIVSTKIAVQQVTEPIVQVITPFPVPFQGGTFPCIDCKDVSAQEFGRCMACDAKHREIVAQLDARPKMPEPIKTEPKLTYRKQVMDGVMVTISTSESLRI